MSNEKQDIGMDRLHAFVDGQLEYADRARLLEEMERDPTLRQQVCELQRTKDYVAFAFESFPLETPSRPPDRRWLRWGQGVAALLLIAVGFAAGRWGATEPELTAAAAPTQQVIVHLNSADSGKFLAALADAEAIARHTDARVEVVANAGGLDLMRSDRSPLAGQVRNLMDRYPNLQFVACNITIGKQRRLGQEPHLIQGIQVAPSAAEHILRRLEQGWSYVRV